MINAATCLSIRSPSTRLSGQKRPEFRHSSSEAAAYDGVLRRKIEESVRDEDEDCRFSRRPSKPLQQGTSGLKFLGQPGKYGVLGQDH
jgi:hypothetical protein